MSGAVRYNAVAMIIHWLTALTVIGLLVVGNIMTDLPRTDPMKLDLYNLHKSFGVTVFFLTLLRLAWRLTHQPPALPEEMPAWEKRAAHAAHWLFYGLLLGVPLLGWIMVSAAPRNVPTVLFGVIEWPHIPYLADQEFEWRKGMKELFENTHAAAAYTIAGLLVLHIGAALRHHFLLKDNVLRRMLPKIIPALLLASGLTLAHSASATEWTVDPAKSDLGFLATQSGRQFEGRFKSWQAEIEFDKSDLSKARAHVLIDMASASTADRQRDSSLPGSDWFNTKQFPKATFEAANFTSKGGDKYEAVGTLEIRGIKKNVTLPFTLDFTGDDAHAVGKLDIVRSDYGVGQGEWVDGSVVGLNVSITFDLAAKKKQ